MEINEVLMKRGMFLTFWLRTKNDYYNVKSELTETAVFKKEIKTEFVRNQDELISGKFSKECCYIILARYWLTSKLVRAKQYGPYYMDRIMWSNFGPS